MGGRVAAIALVPGSRTSFYVGYGIGGIFKTENLGVTFTPVFDAQPNLSIGALAVADGPAREGSDGKGAIVWVGTGEGNNRNSSSWGNGVWRSTDAGATFTHVGLENTHDIPRIAVDPRNPDVLYVAALGHLWGPNPERGLFKTADGGKSWKHVLKVDADTGACDGRSRPRHTHAAPMPAGAPLVVQRHDKGDLPSDDAGATWKKLRNGRRRARAHRPGAVPERPAHVTPWSRATSVAWAATRSTITRRAAACSAATTAARPGSAAVRSTSGRSTSRGGRSETPTPDAPGWDLAISDGGGPSALRQSQGACRLHAIVVTARPDQIIAGNDGGAHISHDRAKS
jgi:hypothetical protein